MVWIFKKAKDFWSWINFIWHILGWTGLAPIVSGVAVMAVGVVGAMIKGLPWPIILMAAYCTLVGVVYLSMAPLAFKVLNAARQKVNGYERKTPNYEAWKYVDKFTLVEASYLWNNLDPCSAGNYTSDVKTWVIAFREAITAGKLEFIPSSPESFDAITYEKEHPDDRTHVSRSHLAAFAIKNNYKREFISQHNDLN